MQGWIHLRFAVGAVALATLTAACASSRTQRVSKPYDLIQAAPSWYPEPPKRDNFVAASGYADSPDLALASSRSRLRARAEVAQVLELRFQGLLKSFGDQTGSGTKAEVLNQFQEIYRGVIDETLTGSQVSDSKIVSLGNNGYGVFSLVEMPIGEANKLLAAKLQANKELWTRFQATQGFEELDRQIKKYEESLKRP